MGSPALARQRPLKQYSGALLAEAVVASFLLIFAFLAASSIYDASLRWSQETTQYSEAALLAERKMEEIRCLISPGASGSLRENLDAIIEDHETSFYSDAPDYKVEVKRIDYVHTGVKSPVYVHTAKLLIPEKGVISPCSSLFTKPDNDNVKVRSLTSPPYLPDPRGDYQRNETFLSYPYSRDFTDSYGLVRVRVSFAAGYQKHFELISLVGDPTIGAKPADPDINKTVTIVGPDSLGSAGSADDFEIKVVNANKDTVTDVSAKWSFPAVLEVFALNAKGNKVRVTNNSDPENNPEYAVLSATIRYNGLEARANKEIRLR